MTADDYNLAEWVLIKRAEREGLVDSEKIKWQLYRNYSGDWRSVSCLENSELQESTGHLFIFPEIIR